MGEKATKNFGTSNAQYSKKIKGTSTSFGVEL